VALRCVAPGAAATPKKNAGSCCYIPGRIHLQGIHVHRTYVIGQRLNLRLGQNRERGHIAPAIFNHACNIFFAGPAELAIIDQCRRTIGSCRVASMANGASLSILCRSIGNRRNRVLCSAKRRQQKRRIQRLVKTSTHADKLSDTHSMTRGLPPSALHPLCRRAGSPSQAFGGELSFL